MALSTLGSEELKLLRLSSIQNYLLTKCQRVGSVLDNGGGIPNAETMLFYLICGFNGSYGDPTFRLGESVRDDVINIWNQACRFLCFEYLVGRPGNMADTVFDTLPTPQEAKGKELRIDSEGRSYFTIPYTQFIDAVSETELGITIAHNITKTWKRKVLGILIIRNFSQLKGEEFTDNDGWIFDGVDSEGNITFRYDPTPRIYDFEGADALQAQNIHTQAEPPN